jgi:hypothetical protein
MCPPSGCSHRQRRRLSPDRANDARYFENKYDHVFSVHPASEATETISWVHGILNDERDIDISARPLKATSFVVDGIRMAHVFYESGLSINVMYGLEDGKKRAVGFKLSESMEVPEELASRFKFVRQAPKPAGTIRGSFFVIKNEHKTTLSHQSAPTLAQRPDLATFARS